MFTARMEFVRRVGWLAVVALVAAAGRAETWQTTRGERFEGKLAGVYGPVTVIAGPKDTTMVSVEVLGDAELERVADYLAARPATVAWNTSASNVAKAVKGRLQMLRNGKLADFDPADRREPEFYLVYFGAGWCPPCRAFSPTLVQAYERLRSVAPDRFEIVFVSSDQSGTDQLNYVKHVAMPWPVLKFSQLGRAKPLERWAGPGIPSLVAVTAEGEVLFNSYHGADYVGPQAVLQDFEGLLRMIDTTSTKGRAALHRLAVVQHVRAAAGGSRSAVPYVIAMDLRRYQTLEVDELKATLALDEKGEVTDITITPAIPAVLNYQLTQDASRWLFLPSVENGRAVRKTVQLPLKLRG